MARRPSKHTRPPRPLSLGGVETSERKSDGVWQVRTITGHAATKEYRCPGCQQVVRVGMPHVVAWPSVADGWSGGVEERRHWHTACWRRCR